LSGEGRFLLIHFTGRVKETGEVFDSTREDVIEEEDLSNAIPGPLLVVTGADMVWEPVDEALREAEPGEKLEVEVPPEKAFGERDKGKVRTYPKDAVSPLEGSLEKDAMVATPDGVGRVLRVEGGRVVVDFNHPLAGKTLVYEIEVVDELEDVEDKVKWLVKTLTDGDLEPAEVRVEDGTVVIAFDGIVAGEKWPRIKGSMAAILLEHCDDMEKVVFEERVERSEED